LILQKILNPVKNKLVQRRYKDANNPFVEFQKIKANDVLPEANQGVIFVGPIKMSAAAHLFEGILGYYYRKRGFKVYAVICGQKLQYCENKGTGLLDNLKCSICYAEQLEFCKTFDLEPLFLGDFLSAEEEREIELASSQINPESIRFKGRDFQSHVTSGLMRVFKVSYVPEDKVDLLKKYAKTSFRTFQSVCNMIERYKPDHVVASHGTYSTWGSLIEACNEKNVHSVVWGRGYVGAGNIMATQNGSYLFKNSEEPMSNFDDVVLSKENIDKVTAYFQGKRDLTKAVDYVNYYSGKEKISAKVELRKILNLDNRKIIGMFPNIPWDGQAFSYSEVFPSIREFIQTSIEWVKTENAYLVIRAHPAEKHVRSKGQMETFQDILFDLYPELPENVIFLPADHEITSYQLEEHIEVALLYAGTLGLEFTINGTPVIQAGSNSNSGKGFIFEPKSKEEFTSLLNRSINEGLELSKEMYENCLRYGYHWIYRRHFPETTVEFTADRGLERYKFKNTDELLEDDMLNQFAHCIETKSDLIYRKR